MSRTTNYPNSSETTSERVPKRFRSHVRHFLSALDRLNTDFEVRCTLQKVGEPASLSVVYTEKGSLDVPLMPLADTPILPTTGPSEVESALEVVAADRPQSRDPYGFGQSFGSEIDTNWKSETLADPVAPAPVPASVALHSTTSATDLPLEERSPLDDSPATALDFPSLAESPASPLLEPLSSSTRDCSLSTILQQMGMADTHSGDDMPAALPNPALETSPTPISEPLSDLRSTLPDKIADDLQALTVSAIQADLTTLDPAFTDDSQATNPSLTFAVQTPIDQRTELVSEPAALITSGQGESQGTVTDKTEALPTAVHPTVVLPIETHIIEALLTVVLPIGAHLTESHTPDQTDNQPDQTANQTQPQSLESLPLDAATFMPAATDLDIVRQSESGPTHAEASVVFSGSTVQPDESSVGRQVATDDRSTAIVVSNGATADSTPLSVEVETAAAALDEASVIFSGLMVEDAPSSVETKTDAVESTAAIVGNQTGDIAFEHQNSTKLVHVVPKREVLVSPHLLLTGHESQNGTSLVHVVPKREVLAPSAESSVVFSKAATTAPDPEPVAIETAASSEPESLADQQPLDQEAGWVVLSTMPVAVWAVANAVWARPLDASPADCEVSAIECEVPSVCSLTLPTEASLTASAASAKSVALEGLPTLPDSLPDGVEIASELLEPAVIQASHPVVAIRALHTPVNADPGESHSPQASVSLSLESVPNSAVVLTTESLPEGLECPSELSNGAQVETLEGSSDHTQQAVVLAYRPPLLGSADTQALTPSNDVSLPVEDELAETGLPASEPDRERTFVLAVVPSAAGLESATETTDKASSETLDSPSDHTQQAVVLPHRPAFAAAVLEQANTPPVAPTLAAVSSFPVSSLTMAPQLPEALGKGSAVVGGQTAELAHGTITSVLPDSATESRADACLTTEPLATESGHLTGEAETLEHDCLTSEAETIERDPLTNEAESERPTIEAEPPAVESEALALEPEPLTGASEPTPETVVRADSLSPATVETPDQGFAEDLFVEWRRLALLQSPTVWGVVVSLEDIFTQGFSTWFAPHFIGRLTAAEGVTVMWGCNVQLVEENPLYPDQERYAVGGKSVVGVTFQSPNTRVLTLETSGSVSSLKPFAQSALTAGLESKPGSAESGNGRRVPTVLLVEETNSPESSQALIDSPPGYPSIEPLEPEEEEDSAPVLPKPGSLWRQGLRLLFGK